MTDRRLTSHFVQHKKRRPAPFSLRLSFEERAKLEKLAGGSSLSAFIKAKVFADEGYIRRLRGKFPVKDHEALGKVLGQLGASRLSQNMNQLAKAAHLGALPVDEDVADQLNQACQDISMMRNALMRALGYTSDGVRR